MGDEVLYPLLRPLLQPLLRMPNERGIGDLSAAIAQLFAAGEQGVWYDPSDFSTLFQDAGGTTPVTGAGQPVGLVKDKSGRGNDATFVNATLATDGAGHFGIACNGTTTVGGTGAVNFSSTDKISVWAGVRKTSDATIGVIVELTTNASTQNGGFWLITPASNGSNSASFGSRGTAFTSVSATGLVAPLTMVLTGAGDIAAPSASIQANQAGTASNAVSQGTGTYANAALNIAARSGGALPLGGTIYSLIVRGAASDATQNALAKTWTNTKAGAY